MARAALALSVSLVLLAPGSARAEAGCPRPCGLDELRARVARSAPAVERAEALSRHAEARLEEAWAAPASVGSARVEVEPTALRHGDALHFDQPDLSFSGEMGLAVRLRLYAVAPASSWWRVASLVRAAGHGVELGRGEVEKQRSEARLALERAFRDAQLAGSRLEAMRRARERLEVALERVRLRLEEDRPGADETDRLRLELAVAELEADQAEARAERSRAESRVRALAGLPREVRLATGPLAEPRAELAPLDWYLESARRGRPEVGMALAAGRGAEALVSLRFGELVPDVGLAGYYSFRSAPIVDDQHNPFVPDLWNGLGAGYGGVVDWTLDPAGTAARVAQARADLQAARALRRLALGAVAFEVERAYAEVVEARAGLEASRTGRRAAARWLDSAAEDLEGGRAGPAELARAAAAWLAQELSCLRASRDLLVALARLEVAAALGPGTLGG